MDKCEEDQGRHQHAAATEKQEAAVRGVAGEIHRRQGINPSHPTSLHSPLCLIEAHVVYTGGACIDACRWPSKENNSLRGTWRTVLRGSNRVASAVAPRLRPLNWMAASHPSQRREDVEIGWTQRERQSF